MPPRRPPRLTDCQRKRQRPANDPTVMRVLVLPGLSKVFTRSAAVGACGESAGCVHERLVLDVEYKQGDWSESVFASHANCIMLFFLQPARRSRNRRKKKKRTQPRAQPKSQPSSSSRPPTRTDMSSQWVLPAITEDAAEAVSSETLTRVDTVLLSQQYPAPPSAPQ